MTLLAMSTSQVQHDVPARSGRFDFTSGFRISRLWHLLLALLAATPALLQIIDGALPQLRMHLNDGYLGRDVSIIKPLMLIAVAAAIATRGIPTIDARLTRLWAILVAYVAALSLFNSFRFYTDLGTNIVSVIDTFGFVVILPFALALIGCVPERPLRLFLVATFVPLALLGLVQFVQNDFILYPMSLDESYVVNSPSVQGQVRAFSLFGAPLKFGYYAAFVLVLLYFSQVGSRGLRRLGWWLLIALAALALVATITRNAYIFAAQMVVAAALIRRQSRHVTYLPVWLLAMSILFTGGAGAAALEQGPDSLAVLSGDSMTTRLEFWRKYSYLWLMEDPVSILFGTGLTQYSRFNVTGEVIIDNFFLAAGNQIGMVGLALLVSMLWRMWTLLLEHLDDARAQSNLVCLAGAAFWSTFLAAGMLNISFPVHIAFFFLIMSSLPPRGATTRGRLA